MARLERWCSGAVELPDFVGSLSETLQVPPDEFWSWHWTLRSGRLPEPHALIGATRVKDLADMIWFVERYRFRSDVLIDSGIATFGRRSEHPWPPDVPGVPDAWARPYTVLRREMGIAPQTPMEARDALAVFLQPVLAEQRGVRSARGGVWSPVAKRSTPPAP